VLNGLDLRIRAGETVAFVGPSGAGKTTICSLLPRFYEVDSGAITIDGIDIRDMTLRSLRNQIGIVQQDVFLFAGTIRENIAYGRLDATEGEIRDAARRARLDQVIASLPAGLDTVIGERGVKLSGGQKQRLAIARIFLTNPPILILDEATSALDTETERAIQQALAELSKGRTTLVIAHRLATIVNADRIAVIDHGVIVEQGKHDELLGVDGYEQILGTDFTYADLGFVRLHPHYRLLGEEDHGGKKTYKIEESVPTERAYYSRVITWVAQDSMLPVQRDYYDVAGNLWKTETFEEAVIDGVPTPIRIQMKVLQGKSSTEIRVSDVRYDVEVPDALFDPLALPMAAGSPVWQSSRTQASKS